jgi:muconolactone delta-isomerase
VRRRLGRRALEAAAVKPPENLSGTAFVVNVSRSRREDLSRDRYAHLWVTPEEPPHAGPFLENLVLPTLQKLHDLQKEGKIRGGGLLAGQRAIALMVEAASVEELDMMIQSLPLWAFMHVQVTPLTPFETRIKADKALIERLKAMA